MIEIKFNQNKKQSIAYDDNKQIGKCDYIELEGTWNIIHTEVSDLYQGQGIARKLVECIIENAERCNKSLIAECSYAKKVIEKKKSKIKLILASSSKQRQDIFDMIGLKYEVVKSLEEEKSTETEPELYVKEISKIKADLVEKQINEKAIIIAADSVIYMNNKIYQKPKTKEDAFNNMKEMSGNVTYAITGVTIKDLYKNKEITFSDTAEVWIRKINEEDIKWYIENDKDIMDRCGYSVLGKAAIFLDKVNGDYNTMIGISPSVVYEKLQELGYKISDFELN